MKTQTAPLLSSRSIAEALVLGPNDSIRFICQKCSFATSGIIPDPTVDERECPGCKSLLFYCPICRAAVSGDKKYKMISCHKCRTDFVTDGTIEALQSQNRNAKEIVLSGIRATGKLHLGNFLGAVRQFVEYQNDGNLGLYFIADWHTLTTCHDPHQISLRSVDVATDYLAAGLDPDKSIIYAQSSVPEIAELALYLSMFYSKNKLEDLATVKDLVRSGETMRMGHLFYPILMAADILGPKATVIPVGSDQVPNVELARDLAKSFNHLFGETFTVPRIGKLQIRVPSLTGGKMGKTDKDTSILLDDPLSEIERKYVKLGVTDAQRTTRSQPGNPDNCLSVYPVYRLLQEEKDPDNLERVNRECRSGSRGCRECKLELAAEIHELLGPFREKKAELAQNGNYVREVLHYGAVKARELVQPTLRDVRERLGIISA